MTDDTYGNATTVDRRVRSVTTAPSGFEGEGFPVRRAFAAFSSASGSSILMRPR